MRPLRLCIEGFTSFREPTNVDFTDAEFFALVGPTGAGKSSVIDAIVFALYGAVPRYDDRRLVAPVITQGCVEARVALDFEAGGRTYRVARVVRASGRGGARAGSGASTKEARLERVAYRGDSGAPDGGLPGADCLEVLAGDAEGVSVAVESLLGLSFEHFTKCVVLPQGAFSRFLHDGPAKRQDLLKELLGLGVYDQVAQRAGLEAVAQGQRALVAEQRLQQSPLSEATPAALDAARHRVEIVTAFQDLVADVEPTLEQLTAESEAAAREARDAALRVTQLEALRVPAGVGELAASAALLSKALAARVAEHERAERAAAEAERAVAALPPRATLEALERHHAERGDLVAHLEKAERELADRVADEAALVERRARAEDAVTAARRSLDGARTRDAAATLAAGLCNGDPCPVCGQDVGDLAGLHGAAETSPLAGAEDDLRTAERRAADARAACEQEAVLKALAEQQRRGLVERMSTIDHQLSSAGLDDPVAVAAALDRVTSAEAIAKQATAAERRLRTIVKSARAEVDEAAGEVATAWSFFDRQRDAVAALGPPSAERGDLGVEWRRLTEWALERVEAERHVASDAQGRAGGLAAERSRRAQTIEEHAEAAGVSNRAGARWGELAAAAVATAQAAVERVAAAIAEAGALRADAHEARQAERTAKALAQHLRATGFERWLLDEVVQDLAAGASEVLRGLSQGAYSLSVRSGEAFAVIDHRNADSVRMARTLSGGETFLASLALALALADRLASFAAAGATPLEAIFLDEGFGSLDAETLDTVAAAIENLAATGRVVGIVTHVRDLAERVPVRFEVSRGPVTSTVRRVEA